MQIEDHLKKILQRDEARFASRIPLEADQRVQALIEARANVVAVRLRLRVQSRIAYAATALLLLTLGAGLVVRIALVQVPVDLAGPLAAETAVDDADARPVDIVDAYRLALRLEAGETLSGGRDVNRDGRVDHSDVEMLTRQAVALGSRAANGV